jgi:dTDP-4-amino-4,6-dideoxygalactose transaminase
MTVSRPVVPLLVPDLPDSNRLLPYLQRMDAVRQYSNFGPLVMDLERRLEAMFSSRAGRPVHVTTVSSATLGIELALASLALPPRSRVLVPALTFVATATAVIRAGHVPVIADIDSDSWALTPPIADAAFAEAPFDAVIPVATFGQSQNWKQWNNFQRRRGIPVVIDAAAGFGSQWIGDAAQAPPIDDTPGPTLVFSLHTTKSLPAGEGGLVVATNAQHVREVRQRSNYGINRDDPEADLPLGATDMIGTNAKLSEYHAAVALASLERWNERAAVRRDVMRRYRATLVEASRGQLQWQAGEPVAAPTLLCVRWPGDGKANRLEQICAERGVMTRRWYQPLLHRQPARAGALRHLSTPVADRIAAELIGLPFFPDMSTEQIDLVAQCVASVAGSPQPSRPFQAAVRPSDFEAVTSHTLPYGHS